MANDHTQQASAGQKSAETKRIQARVAEYFSKRPGVEITYAELCGDLNLAGNQVSSSITHLRQRHGLNIITLVPGALYRYMPGTAPAVEAPAAPPTRHVYEQVGVTREGAHIIQAEDGTLYRATEL